MTLGTLVEIYMAPRAAKPMQRVEIAHAVAGLGLEGDRYFLGKGAFSRWPGIRRQVSLIEIEAIDAVARDHQIDLSAGLHRRNLVTRGVPLLELNGKHFRIGEALFRGTGACPPCKYLEKKTLPGVFAALAGRGGLRAEVIEPGDVRAGDAITLV